MSKKMLQEMNDQIQREMESAYIYLSMAAYFDAKSLPGFAQWMKIQFQEEQIHAMKFYEYIIDRGGKVSLQPINQPPVDFNSPLEVFEKALAHEEKVSGHINDLYALSIEEKDYASRPLLQWFIDEQVEEEANAGQIVDTLKMIKDNTSALLMFDRELGQRQAPVESQGGGGE
jgi:ferritin